MRLDFMQRQRAWEAERAREAPRLPSDPPEEEYEDSEHDYELSTLSGTMQSSAQMTLSQPVFAPEEVVDEVAQREDEELEALLSYMPGEEGDGKVPTTSGSDHLWSDDGDDDDYDALFSELMDCDGEQKQQSTSSRQQTTAQSDGAMDLS